jgi:hypothetical protein
VTECHFRRPVIVLAAALVLSTTACSLTFDATRMGVPVTMASAASAPAQGTPFKVTRHAVYGLWGLARLTDPSLRKALETQLVGGKGVADLRIKVRSRFGDLLITALTGGLIVPRSVTYEGVVLK